MTIAIKVKGHTHTHTHRKRERERVSFRHCFERERDCWESIQYSATEKFVVGVLPTFETYSSNADWRSGPCLIICHRYNTTIAGTSYECANFDSTSEVHKVSSRTASPECGSTIS